MSLRHLPITAICLAAAGCMVGPDFKHPDVPDVKGYRSSIVEHDSKSELGIPTQHYDLGADVPEKWWLLFESSSLNALVDRSLARNPNIDVARASLRTAQESAAAQRGTLWPQVSASVTPTRQRIADSLSSPLNSAINPFSLHTAQVSVAYAPDVFGANRRAIESLEAQAEVQRYELEAARLSLAANVVLAAIEEASLRSQIATTSRMLEIQTELLELAHRQLALGAISESAAIAQEASLAQTRTTLPPLRKQLAQTRDLLLALAGEFPDKDLDETFDFDHLELPRNLPLSLPSKLVQQRPDVRAAEAQGHAAAAQVGVAFANMLPQFNITAGAGTVAEHFGDMFKSGTGFWGLVGSVSQPFFDGSSLRHRKAAAEAEYDQALAQYRSTVISAFQNVADTLNALEQDAAYLASTSQALDAAKRSFMIAQRQAALGDISHLMMINAEQVYCLAQLAQAQAKANRYADTTALFQALGGGVDSGRQKEQEGRKY